jgi:dienelactone hydrolase
MLAPATRLIPVFIDVQTVHLNMCIYQPVTPGPRPTLVFNHGSTGSGTDPQRFTQPIDEPHVARLFVQHGWAVILPARRGRAHSDGVYDEGFERDRSLGYTCDPPQSLAGADRALADIAAAIAAIQTFPFVDHHKIVIGGQSRGGILSVAYAGLHPEQIRGVLNFVGGWLGTGCPTASHINQTLFRRGAAYPGETLWLYGDGDPFYPLAHSRENFVAFRNAGGNGTFQTLQPPEENGHRLVAYPEVWESTVRTYLQRIGLPFDVPAPPQGA